MGVQVPHVNSAQDARRAVEAVKYHPHGIRGLAAGSRPANYGFGISMSDYVVEANEETLVCVQLEEAEAIKNIDEILQVDGVDVFFVGPSDLSQSLGYPGRSDVPEVREVINSTFARIKSAAKVSGSAGNAGATNDYIGRRVQYLYTHFTTLFSSASRDFLAQVKDQAS